MERKQKEEHKEWKRKRKELMVHHTRNHQSVPDDLEEMFSQSVEVKELPNHTITIVDMSNIDIAGCKGFHLGKNKFTDSNDPSSETGQVNLPRQEEKKKALNEFLTGFKKRKDERRKKAHEQMERKQKEEHKEWKRKRKELMVHHTRNHQSVPDDLEEMFSQSVEVKELPNHTITIVDMSNIDIAGCKGFHLGKNKFTDSNDPSSETGQVNLPRQEEKKKALKKLDKKHLKNEHLQRKNWPHKHGHKHKHVSKKEKIRSGNKKHGY